MRFTELPEPVMILRIIFMLLAMAISGSFLPDGIFGILLLGGIGVTTGLLFTLWMRLAFYGFLEKEEEE